MNEWHKGHTFRPLAEPILDESVGLFEYHSQIIHSKVVFKTARFLYSLITKKEGVITKSLDPSNVSFIPINPRRHSPEQCVSHKMIQICHMCCHCLGVQGPLLLVYGFCSPSCHSDMLIVHTFSRYDTRLTKSRSSELGLMSLISRKCVKPRADTRLYYSWTCQILTRWFSMSNIAVGNCTLIEKDLNIMY